MSISDLVGLTYSDSQGAYGGEVTPHTAKVDLPYGSTSRFSKMNLSGYRMFPEWNPTTKKSVTKVDYNFSVGLFGRRVTLNAGDSLGFVIRTTAFKFNEMYGIATEQYKRTGMASAVSVQYPWPVAVIDSLRGKLVSNQVLAKFLTRLTVPQGATIDTMHVFHTISSATDFTVSVADSEVFLHVSRDSVYTRFVDITKVMNNYPNSVKVKIGTTIPVQTRIIMENDLTNATDPNYPKYMGRMIVPQLLDISFP
jgi:hypothetical protein